MFRDNVKKFSKRLKKMTQAERDELLVETFKKISDLDEKEIAISIKHLEKSGYKVTKK